VTPQFVSKGLPVTALVGGLIGVAVGALLPYAYLADGSIVAIDPARPIVLEAVSIGAWLTAGSDRTRRLAAALALGTIAVTAYLLIVGLRSIPGWAAVSYGQDGRPGPALLVVAVGIVIIGIGTVARAAGQAAGFGETTITTLTGCRSTLFVSLLKRPPPERGTAYGPFGPP
jgi:hypothetical protein